ARESRGGLAVNRVGGANLDLFEAAKHVEQHHGDRIHATQAARVTQGNNIEPTAAPRAPCDRAVFIAAFAQVLAGRVVLFGREGAAADAGRISFHGSDHAVDIPPRYT